MSRIRSGEKTPQQPYPSLLHPENRPHPSTVSLDPDAEEEQLTADLLGLFTDKAVRPSLAQPHFETRTPLQVEFTLFPVLTPMRKYMFGVSLKVGLGRFYIVQQLHEFLDRVDKGQRISFSAQFAYDPALYCFQPADDAILRQLIQLSRNDQLFQQGNLFTSAKKRNEERQQLIPPYAWDSLQPLFAEAPMVKLEHERTAYSKINFTDAPLPLYFTLDQEQDSSYRLDFKGMELVTALDLYGLVLHEGNLHKLPAEYCQRLADMKDMLESRDSTCLRIPPEQISAYIETVIPGLVKMGTVHIAEGVSSQMEHTPLKARLYLDRVHDKLLAGLEFQYGSIIFNPLEENDGKGRTDRILIRDRQKEQRILSLMAEGAFARTESGFYLDEEEDQYHFLYHLIPEMEKLAEIHATTAVKVRLLTKHAPPRITVNVDERTNWLDFRFHMDGISESEIRKLLLTLEEKRRYYRLPNGSLMPLETEEMQEIVRFLNEFGIGKGDLRGAEFRLPVARGLHLTEFAGTSGAIRLGKSFRQLLENMRNPDHLEFPVPEGLSDTLRDYQKYGFGWMKTLAHYRFGGILADDMGLGKTVQSIAFLVSVLPEIREQKQPALIVCPASLLYNWQQELNRFAPQIHAVIADGAKKERSKWFKQPGKADVIITSYPLLRRDIEEMTACPFHTLILDEAQMFKNWTTQTAQAVKEIGARYRFALTGTPVENSLEELWSIFDAVFPELFPDRKAFLDMPRPLVAKRIRPFLLRRVKTDVLEELPEKIESLQASELLPEQKKLYAAYLAKLRHETLKHLDKETFQKNRIRILAGLTRLRQLCCHPGLFVEVYTGGSAKLAQLLELVEECRGAGKRMLIFSQFTGMLKLIGQELMQMDIPYFYLDGATPSAERVELCSRFNNGERDFFLISLKAGGTGLNLTGADTVVLYDMWWNPAVEDQAADRAHRIGQKNVVQVIRLVSRGTVEEKMYALQKRKKNLIDEVIQPGEQLVSSLTEADLREILQIV
ncbi:DEAD/DEAH box helicase [Gorillibacterium massiliense]|uniref:DEAD/DEAH box helicase n=1 Tax=Gorillibacterium massiliense TaxID=1280390 RepID=UPI0004B0348D|nr:DEAD/DEAH box helicase [Gorillibacterium massiliense]